MFFDASEAFAMEFADAILFDRSQMFPGAVTFMSGKIVLGIFLMVFVHHAVPGHFGDDGGGGDGIAQLIAFRTAFWGMGSRRP